jgi:outer membrane protein assembly factor BamB
MTWLRLFPLPLAGLLLAGTLAANWPQWRGPNQNGTAPQAKDLPVTFSATENLLWRVKLPNWSAATPAVWGDQIFVTSSEEGFVRIQGQGQRGGRQATLGPDKIFLLSLRRKDGSVLWQREIDTNNQLFRKQNSASPSPITDGKFVWIMTGNGKLVCFTTVDGKEVWKRDIQAEYGKFGLNHGYASTPLLHENRLYVQVIHGMKTDDPSYVFAVDKLTGKNIWKVERPTDAKSESPDNYGTPQIVTAAGGKLQLVISGADYATGHDLATGRELWRLAGFNPTDNPANRTIASTLVIGGNVFVTSTRGRPFIAFRPGGEGNITGKNELWTNNLGSDVPTPTTDGKLIYVLVDNGVMHCLEADSGKVVYQNKRIELGTYSASPLLADGKIYNLSEEGTVTVMKAGPNFEVLAVNKLDNHALASPVAVGGQLFIRTDDYLYCFQKTRAN